MGVSFAYASVVVREGEEAQESFEYAVGESYEDVKDMPAKAVQSALDTLGATTVPSGKCKVLFSGKQFRSFLSVFSSAFSAKNAQMGLSLLAGKAGEQIAAECVTVTDDPMREGCPMQTNFDGEGVATARRNVIEKDQLLKQIDRLGNEVQWGLPGGFTVFGSPDVLVRDMSVAGK